MAQQRMNVQAPIERLLAERWSTCAFDPERQITEETLASCLEAARWAPSCFGEEPWRFVVANRFEHEDDWQGILACLAAKNRLWAMHAPVLIVTAAAPSFSHNGNPNRWAEFDAGQAAICLCLQAGSLGLVSHQMGGFDADALKQAIGLPEQIHVISVTAIGYPGAADSLGEDFQDMEAAPRTRRPLAEIVHAGHWDKAWKPPANAGWEARYQETSVECLPWFHPGMDVDIEQALERFEITSGNALDIGCGPGTQSIALAKRGFSVTATDISRSAVEATRLLAGREGVSIESLVDDVLDSRLTGPFDLVLDRGIFHCFPEPADQQAYLATVTRLLRPNGALLLKCFHKDETSEMGPPCRYDATDIRRLFANGFELMQARDCQFQRMALNDPPRALCCVLMKQQDAR